MQTEGTSMKRVRCDNCGQESPFFEAGTPCTMDLTDGKPCPGTYRDPSVEVTISTPPGVTSEQVIESVTEGLSAAFGQTPQEAPTNPGKRKIAQHSSKSQEHYTPSPIVEVARKVMGEIELDPASCEKANTVVKAKHFFTKEDDGLTRVWAGLVYCNPPGGKVPGTNQSQAQAFFFKAVNEWKAGHVQACCFLGFTLEILRLTQRGEGFPGYSACDFAFCVLKERTQFLDEDLKPQEDPTHANVLVLISHDKAMIRKFYVEAQKLGAVVVNADLVL